MPAVLQGVVLFVVGCLVVYGLIACVGRGTQDGHDKPHGGHGHH